MRAIHNTLRGKRVRCVAVVMMSKVRKMRAIHNYGSCKGARCEAVVMMSKVRKMRAIHNLQRIGPTLKTLL